ncbi:SDR family NAD(P)-dependent oxidoreductase [Chengkuizengella sediminis]|uniref:SDR family NAD(P)-dependent oxidoreductase n=1 Tax=Chengkuizengella sediminis TaxID=1885917 RepID=UPI0013896D8C|nr:3-oxoacyl-ACP reductase family protein [Chengkuizengella sediminis]NDI34083.1 3-oxoacyl-ACP reductase FabG [Chengkuizengella sediminis]
MNLTNMVAVVTGSSRGIGKAIALELAKQGSDVAIVYRGQKEKAIEVMNQIESLGRRAMIFQADVTNPDDVDKLVVQVTNQLGSIDILVNNVGEFHLKPISKIAVNEWDEVFKSNLHSVFYMCKAVIPGMRKRGMGRIVNIGLSPNYIVRGAPNVAAYSIAKTGVIIFSRSLAVEEASYGITVNCISPGLIENGYQSPEQVEWMRQRVPMKRLGTPEEIADAVSFLVSERASYISGANLSVSGAWDWEDRPTDHDHIVHELFVEDGIK